jgi:hypothetical protein
VAWAVWAAAWTIKPTVNRHDEGPGFVPGLSSFASHGMLPERSILGLKPTLRLEWHHQQSQKENE